jgi:large subunit ribosomal protein L28
MSRVCEVCGKGTRVGNRIAWRGKPKYQGGVGLKVHGISKRKFKANIQSVRVNDGGTVRRLKICASCLRISKYPKAVH